MREMLRLRPQQTNELVLRLFPSSLLPSFSFLFLLSLSLSRRRRYRLAAAADRILNLVRAPQRTRLRARSSVAPRRVLRNCDSTMQRRRLAVEKLPPLHGRASSVPERALTRVFLSPLTHSPARPLSLPLSGAHAHSREPLAVSGSCCYVLLFFCVKEKLPSLTFEKTPMPATSTTACLASLLPLRRVALL